MARGWHVVAESSLVSALRAPGSFILWMCLSLITFFKHHFLCYLSLSSIGALLPKVSFRGRAQKTRLTKEVEEVLEGYKGKTVNPERKRARFGKEKTSQARISKRKRKKVREGGDGRRIKIKNTTLASFLSILSFWARLVFFIFPEPIFLLNIDGPLNEDRVLYLF